MSVSVLLVDDHERFRFEARAMLEAGGYEVAAEAADAASALREAERIRPDVVLLDLGLPDRSGLDLVVPIRSVAPRARVILVSARPRTDFGERIAASGADAFIDKTALTPVSLAAALRGVATA
jgi:DNA-binding NarL/FixJ family response regulator